MDQVADDNRKEVYGPIALGMVDAWVATLVPRITDRQSVVRSMCHIMRRSRRSSECNLCDDGFCCDPAAHAAADLAIAMVMKTANDSINGEADAIRAHQEAQHEIL